MPIQTGVVDKTQNDGELGLAGHSQSEDTKTAGKPNLAVGEQRHTRNLKVQENSRDQSFLLKLLTCNLTFSNTGRDYSSVIPQ